MMRDRARLSVLLSGFLLLGSVCAAEAPSTDESATRAYIYLKQDPDLFVGEGVATAKEFDGDEIKALAAARERAKAALADSVKVSIHSEVSEKTQSQDGKVSEDLKAESKSQADVSLENVKFLELKDYPGTGKETVLASLSKEDYRRQLAGKKVSVYLPQWGLQVMARQGGNDWEQQQYNQGLDLGLELLFKSFIVGLSAKTDDDQELIKTTNPNGGHDITPQAKYTQVDLGYNWTPWAFRFQPFVPLRLTYEHIQLNLADPYPPAEADLFGFSAGLGFRYWPADSFALEVSLRDGWRFNTVTVKQQAYQADLYAGGPQFDIGLLWSGF
jgi:hypothetical protein